MTAGSTVGMSERDATRAWRDGTDRLVIRSNGHIGIGDGFTNPEERLHVRGNIRAEGNLQATGDIVASGAKKSEIKHPLKAGRKVVHAAMEGPESALYYRGEAQLTNGRAVIDLPEYFEALTRPDGRTVMLTNADGFDRLAVERRGGKQVTNGQFTVVSDNSSSSQAFNWEVKAVRADIAVLQVEE